MPTNRLDYYFIRLDRWNGMARKTERALQKGKVYIAYTGIPGTHRDCASTFALVTGHGRVEKGTDHIK